MGTKYGSFEFESGSLSGLDNDWAKLLESGRFLGCVEAVVSLSSGLFVCSAGFGFSRFSVDSELLLAPTACDCP